MTVRFSFTLLRFLGGLLRIRVLGGFGGLCPGYLLTSFAVDDSLIIDAGSLAEGLDIEEQSRVRNVILTHSHLDHTCTLPFFADNIFGISAHAVQICALPETLKSIRTNLFNNAIWPDFSALPNVASPTIQFNALESELPTAVGTHTVTPIRVHHTVPTVGYLIERDGVCVAFSGDTSSTERIWELAGARSNLAGLFIETSFPNRLQRVADISGHLTPQGLAEEVAKLGRDVPVFVYHIKPRFLGEIERELAALGHSTLSIVEQGRTYEFG